MYAGDRQEKTGGKAVRGEARLRGKYFCVPGNFFSQLLFFFFYLDFLVLDLFDYH